VALKQHLCFSLDYKGLRESCLSLKKSGLCCGIFLILVLGLVTSVIEYETVYHKDTREIANSSLTLSYTPSDPIQIQSDVDFETQGWPGNGTLENPYIIKGLDITSELIGISISDTSACFEVVSCHISSESLTSNPGIKFDNVMLGSVKSCNIDVHDFGVTIFNSTNCTFIKNTFVSNYIGLDLNCSTFCEISENTISYPAGIGILVHEVSGCLLSQNFVRGNQEVGISLEYLTNSTVSNCSISCNKLPNQMNTGFYGLLLENCILTGNEVEGDDNQYGYDLNRFSNCILINNSVDHCSQGLTLHDFVECAIILNKVFENSNGIYAFKLENCTLLENSFENNQHGVELREARNCSIMRNVLMYDLHDGFTLDDVHNCSIIENQVKNCRGGFYMRGVVNCVVLSNIAAHNERYGFELDSGCENNTLYLNRIGLNEMGNSIDDGTSNVWDNSIDTGNYWADYSGEGYYEIPGNASSVDRFPFYWNINETDESPLSIAFFIGLATVALTGLIIIIASIRRK